VHPLRLVAITRLGLVGVGVSVFSLACAPTDSASTPSAPSGDAPGSLAPIGSSSSGASGSGASGSPATAGFAGSYAIANGDLGGASGSAASGGASVGGATSAGAPSGGWGGTASGGANAIAGSGGAMSGASGSAGAPPSGCNLPATVSFQKDVQKFLSASCSGTSCHVIDAQSTMASGGYDHAYDWITATSHASSCPSGSPKRFEVVLAVINAGNPASCAKSRIMPPDPGTHAPLTPCQVATLQAWLAEPKVTQLHRADDTSPTTPYAMPPFN
jgi:hypothetical protein